MKHLEKLLRPDLKKLQPYNAGLGLADIRAKYQVSDIAKLGSNENPYGPSARVFDALEAAAGAVFLYPDAHSNALGAALSKALGVAADTVTFGNGSEELLSIICRAVVKVGDRVITLYPSFPLHEDYVTLMGGSVERVCVRSDLKINMKALLAAVAQPAKMLIFANPMNPVGAVLNPAQLRQVIEAKHADTLLVLDEAYFEYACHGDYASGLDMLGMDDGHWIVLRTFSKAWGLAGLRIGFGVCSSAELKSALDLVRTPFNINAMAQAAALAALDDDDHMKEKVSLTLMERQRVDIELLNMGFAPASGLGNFLFFDVNKNSCDVAEDLLKQGIIVKPWKQPGFESFIRVSIGTVDENNQFLAGLRAISAAWADYELPYPPIVIAKEPLF